MPRDSLLKFVSPAAVGGNAAQSSSKAIKKERSLKSLLSLFKLSKHDKSPGLSESRYPNHKPTTKALGFSTASLPAQTSKKEDEDGENADNDSPQTGHWHSTTSLPAQVRPPFTRHSPTSSSSSASSFEFPSDASTAATSPSNSSPSVLIKSIPSTSITTMGLTTSVVNYSSAEYSSPLNHVPIKLLKMPKPSKRVADGYQKQPSPLSSVMDAHSPYTFPTPPQMSTHKNQARRRSSLGNFLLRRSQSHPDLADLTQEDLPPLPPMPASTPSPQPKSSSSSISRAKSFRRRSADSRKGDGYGGYTDQEKLERISILGADPAGYGYYLYPTSQKETDNQRNSGIGQLSGKRGGPGSVDDWNKGSWGGSSSGGPGGGRGTGAPSNRAWKDSRGRGFRGTVTQQAIPEEVGDTSELESISPQSASLRQNPTSAEPVLSIPKNEMTIVTKITSFDEKERRQIPNNYNSIQENKKVQELSLQVPCAQTNVLHNRDQDDKLVLRVLQQRVMDAADSAVEGRVASPGTARSGESTKVVGMKDNLPMVVVEA